MEKKDIKIIGELFREALGGVEQKIVGEVHQDIKSLEKSTKEIFAEVSKEIASLKLMQSDDFAEVKDGLKDIEDKVDGFTRTHEILDGRVTEQERKLNTLERKMEKIEQLIEKLAH